VESLCSDLLYFARPATFNDPLDCNPSLESDSEPSQLRELLAALIKRRVSKEVLTSLERANVKGSKATAHAERQANHAAESELKRIEYYATNPECKMGVEEATTFLLTRGIEEELLRDYESGVCCFSTSFSSPLLWSHYSDQHRGLCIGYDLDRLPKPPPQQVVYGGSRIIKTSTVIRAFLDGEPQAWSDLHRDILLRKSKGWSYEREWRLVGRHGLQKSPLRMVEVTFGLRCPSQVIFAVTQMLKNRNVPINFFKMVEHRGLYSLRRKPLDLAELESDFPQVSQSGEEMFGEPLKPSNSQNSAS
jgi:hypothetical protein